MIFVHLLKYISLNSYERSPDFFLMSEKLLPIFVSKSSRVVLWGTHISKDELKKTWGPVSKYCTYIVVVKIKKWLFHEVLKCVSLKIPRTFHCRRTVREAFICFSTEYWAFHILQQIYIANPAKIQIYAITVKMCGNFWGTQYISCVFSSVCIADF